MGETLSQEACPRGIVLDGPEMTADLVEQPGQVERRDTAAALDDVLPSIHEHLIEHGQEPGRAHGQCAPRHKRGRQRLKCLHGQCVVTSHVTGQRQPLHDTPEVVLSHVAQLSASNVAVRSLRDVRHG